jgi:protocatechuate 3,4-dioxygenase beta subunit
MRSPTPACPDDDERTAETTEGPFFSTGSPERTSLREPDDGGIPFTLSGMVTDRECTPLGGAKIELWHAGPDGQYDNEGFTYRGHFFTAADGTFSVDTVKAGLYPGRTRHFHVKVQPEGADVLTSQLFWPDEPDNDGDGIFDERLLMDVVDEIGTERGTFQFVV